jgi:hypothetical protein
MRDVRRLAREATPLVSRPSLCLPPPAFYRREHGGPTGDGLHEIGRTKEREAGSQSTGTSVEETK